MGTRKKKKHNSFVPGSLVSGTDHEGRVIRGRIVSTLDNGATVDNSGKRYFCFIKDLTLIPEEASS